MSTPVDALKSAALTIAPSERRGEAWLLTELFPPAIGGSATLLHGIYSRLHGSAVRVVADDAHTAVTGCLDDLTVFRRRLHTEQWGVFNRQGATHHFSVARYLCQHVPRRSGIVHCARSMPEGVAALMARLLGGPRYVCWAHGEDLTTARSSKEYELLTKAVFRFASAAIANSRNTAEMLLTFGVPDSRIHIVYPAVDADRFHPEVDHAAVRRRFAADGDTLLLSVGRLQRRKGHDTAILAVAALRDRCPRLRYVIAGDGEERARLQALAHEHGVADRVVFAGVVPDADLPALYAACDIFLLANRIDDGDIEGFGIVFLEAAASGKPVIGGASGGVPEAVGDATTGVLVDGASVEAVAAAIDELASSPARRHSLGIAGRERVRNLFSWQRAAARVSQLQAQLVARK